jgi:hypothetical protein
MPTFAKRPLARIFTNKTFVNSEYLTLTKLKMLDSIKVIL